MGCRCRSLAEMNAISSPSQLALPCCFYESKTTVECHGLVPNNSVLLTHLLANMQFLLKTLLPLPNLPTTLLVLIRVKSADIGQKVRLTLEYEFT